MAIELAKNLVLELNSKKKKLEGLALIIFSAVAVLIILTYIVFLRDMALLQNSFLADFFTHVKFHITNWTMLGSLYVAFFGGMFFIFVPMEGYFVPALQNNNGLVLFTIFIIGILVSYSIDYLIGLKLSKIAKRLVSPRKFYKIKSIINRHGKLAILVANIIPFLPSQQVTFILGVFKYNKLRLLIFTMLGQMLKYMALLAVFSTILK